MDAKPTTQFQRDFRKRIAGTPLEGELETLVGLLLAGGPLPEKYRDHPLKGDRTGLRDCHLRPDMVVLYRKTGDRLSLVRIGSHSEIFG